MTDERQVNSSEIAERVVAMALEAGASQAEAVVIDGHSALTRFANNEMHQSVAEDDTVVSLRFIDGRRIGVASANRYDDPEPLQYRPTSLRER